MGSVAGLVRRPSGRDHEKKTGWDGSSVPPGLAKKQSLQSKVVHRAMFFRHGEEALESQGITRIQVANFDRFLDLNPGLERTLMQHPSLINNQPFLASQPSFTAWLKAHPRIAEELRENPQAFMVQEGIFEANETNRRMVANFDLFLDANPSLAASLSKKPSLINNSAFLAKNPALATWLKAHPEAAEEIRENPQAFFSLEHRVEATRHEQARGPEAEEQEGSDDL